MIKFVYFDAGDVLFTYPHAFKKVADRFNTTEKAIHEIFVENGKALGKGQMDISQLWRIICQRLRLRGAEEFDFQTYWIDQYIPSLAVHALAREISGKYKVGLLTNNFKNMREALFSRKLIPDIEFQSVIFSCEIGYKKPEREIYAYAQKQSGVSPFELFFIDDRQDFIEGAEKAGWNTFRFDPSSPDKSISAIKKILGL